MSFLSSTVCCYLGSSSARLAIWFRYAMILCTRRRRRLFYPYLSIKFFQRFSLTRDRFRANCLYTWEETTCAIMMMMLMMMVGWKHIFQLISNWASLSLSSRVSSFFSLSFKIICDFYWRQQFSSEESHPQWCPHDVKYLPL